MAWRTARSLLTLGAEIRAEHPGTTIWTIGDPAHASRCSRHNPNRYGVVTAYDILPNAGLDIHALADRLVAAPHDELDYVISNRRVASRRTNWRWHRYLGSNGHVSHIHVAAGTGTDCDPLPPYDSTRPWGAFSPPSDQEDEVTPDDITAVANAVRELMKPELDALETDIKAHAADLRNSLSDLTRRITGTPVDENSRDQHALDRVTGDRIQKAISTERS